MMDITNSKADTLPYTYQYNIIKYIHLFTSYKNLNLIN